jgi:DNA repair protein RadC
MKGKYAYSIKTSKVKEPDFPYQGQKLTCTTETFEFVRALQDADIEKMIVIYLDAQNVVIGILPIIGTVNQAVVYPREVLRHALLCNAVAIILAHNHPSGTLTPSDSDIRLTKQIQETAKTLDIVLHDHVIVAGGRAFSLREEGLIF